MVGGQTLNTKTIALICCIAWFMVAWTIDTFWLTVLCSQCSSLFAFEFELTAKDLVHLKTDRVSAIFLFVVPFVAYLFVVIPYKELRSKSAWLNALQSWTRPLALLLLVAVLVWALESVYTMLAPHLPVFVTSYAEKYLLKISGTVLGVKEVDITGRLGALVGLLWGGYVFLSRGIAAPIARFAASSRPSIRQGGL